MAIQHLINVSWSDGGNKVQSTNTITVINEANLSEVIATGSGGVTKNLVYDPTNIQTVIILLTGLADGQTAVLTTYDGSNGTGSVKDTITLTQDVPLIWVKGSGVCQLQTSTLIKSVKCVQTNSFDGQLDIRIGYN